jgi:hypothetical protein
VLSGVNVLTKIDLNIRGALGADVAVALSRALRMELAVPTSLLKKPINVKLKKTPVGAVIKHLGFIKMPGSGRAPSKRKRSG